MKAGKLGLLIICIFFLGGCWDKKELNDLAVVMGVGIDKVENNEGDETFYEITAQVIKPEAQAENGAGSELPTWSVSAENKTIMGAIKKLNQLSPRRLYWAHLQIIILGEDLAKEGVSPVITWFERDRDSRAGSFIVVTQGRAKDLLNQKIELGNVPSKSMAELLDGSQARQITARQIKLRDFMTILSTPGIDPSLDVINPEVIRGEVESYHLTGVAVFKDDKLVGYIKGPEAIGTELVQNNYNNSILEAKCPGYEKEYFAYQITDFDSRTKLIYNNGELTYKIDIFIEGNLSDQTCPVDLLKQREQVEEQISKEIISLIENEFTQARDMGADIYGIGQELRRNYPEVWAQKKEQLNDLLAEMEFDINVTSNIRRSGLIIEPTQIKIE